MKKEEYLERLAYLLADLPEEERQAAVEYYTDYLEDAGPEGEQEAMEHLGRPEKVAEVIREGLKNDETSGTWTDAGYRSSVDGVRYEVARNNEKDAEDGSRENRKSRWYRGRDTDGQRSYKEQEENRGAYYEEAPGASQSYEEADGWYEQDKATAGSAGEGNDRTDKKRSLGWILLLAAGIFIFGIPLISTVGGILTAVAAALLSLIVGGFAVFLALGLTGIMLIVRGILRGILVASGLGMGFMGVGLGFLCLAGALLGLLVGLWMVKTVIPGLINWFLSLCRRVFGRGRS